jgi:hypothetical protein
MGVGVSAARRHKMAVDLIIGEMVPPKWRTFATFVKVAATGHNRPLTHFNVVEGMASVF